ncbi:hypothetical protein EST38_g5959 [Candolleomyces aberdarensis]|uniref:DRBM domain-containing protein n=1 Tax=Candolleomyces aberdarensis TaxID=2316362 RepID=A0A4Q2DIT4_9AGAR|nr:hypothetical protein EST38_g5959 [Candolleomyces aberdarensis]
MADGYCMTFNNAAQKVFGSTVRPIVETWKTNNRAEPWSAEARLVGQDGISVVKIGPSSAPKKQRAKDLAARSGFEWLCSQYPEIDFSDL